MSHFNDPDQVIRIPKITLQLTILDAEERGFKKAQAELGKVQSELQKQNQELKTENKELKKEIASECQSERKWADYYYDNLQKAETKNARLREALIMIVEGTDNKYPHPCSLDHDEINGISREALKGGE
jgi:hypothetical protein